jgi:hypothetical protein
MIYIVIFISFLPFLTYLAIVIRRGIKMNRRLQNLEEHQKELQQLNRILKIEKEELERKQAIQDKQLERYKLSNEQKQEILDKYTERQLDFHLIKFGRIPAWGSPAYSITVDALGNVLYQGKEAVRLIGFYQWKIYRKRIKNINSIINKSNFFKIKGNEFYSEIEDVSGVVIEIYLKNGFHRKVQYDHGAEFPTDLSFLERKLDMILGTKKLWLFWAQNVVKLSIRRGLNYRCTFEVNKGIYYRILEQEFYSRQYTEEWESINKILKIYENLWYEDTAESYNHHPADTIWIEIESGFRFLISAHKHPEPYLGISKVVENFGETLQKSVKRKGG